MPVYLLLQIDVVSNNSLQSIQSEHHLLHEGSHNSSVQSCSIIIVMASETLCLYTVTLAA